MISYRREYVTYTYPASWVHHFGANIPGSSVAHFVEVRTGEVEHLSEQQVVSLLRQLANCIDGSPTAGRVEEMGSHFSMMPLFPLADA